MENNQQNKLIRKGNCINPLASPVYILDLRSGYSGTAKRTDAYDRCCKGLSGDATSKQVGDCTLIWFNHPGTGSNYSFPARHWANHFSKQKNKNYFFENFDFSENFRKCLNFIGKISILCRTKIIFLSSNIFRNGTMRDQKQRKIAFRHHLFTLEWSETDHLPPDTEQITFYWSDPRNLKFRRGLERCEGIYTSWIWEFWLFWYCKKCNVKIDATRWFI